MIFIKLFEDFNQNNEGGKLEWVYNQAKEYAETFIEDDEESYNSIMSTLEKFKEDPESMTIKEYADILYQVASNNYYKLGEAEITYPPMTYDEFLVEVENLMSSVLGSTSGSN